jgi:hypothetical protein
MKHVRNANLLTGVRGNNNNRDSSGAPLLEDGAPAVTAHYGAHVDNRLTRMFAPSNRASFDDQDNVTAATSNRDGRPFQAHEMSNLSPTRTSDPQTGYGYYGTGTHEPITTAPPLSTLVAGYPRDVKVPPSSEPSQSSQFQTPQPTTMSTHAAGTEPDAVHAQAPGEQARTEHIPPEHSNRFREKLEEHAALERTLKSDSQVSLPPPY